MVGRDREFSHVVGGSTYIERGAGRSGLRDGQSRTMGVTKLDGLARRGRGLIRLARLDVGGSKCRRTLPAAVSIRSFDGEHVVAFYRVTGGSLLPEVKPAFTPAFRVL